MKFLSVNTPWQVWDWRKDSQQEDFSFSGRLAEMGFEIPYGCLLRFNSTFHSKVRKDYIKSLRSFVRWCKDELTLEGEEVVALIATKTSFALLTKIKEEVCT